MHILERSTFAKPQLKFKIGLQDIPPIIPPKQRKYEINTEKQKNSVYLKRSGSKVEGESSFDWMEL